MPFLTYHLGMGLANGLSFIDQVDHEAALGRYFFSQLAQRTIKINLAIAQNDHAVAEGFDIVHVMRGEKHGHLLFFVEVADEIAHGQFAHSFEADRWLIEEKDSGRVQEGCCQVAAHALAEAQEADGTWRAGPVRARPQGLLTFFCIRSQESYRWL